MLAKNGLIQSALALHGEGRVSEAEAVYRQVLEIDPRQPIALSMLGTILMEAADKSEAEALLRRHLDVAPDNPFTLLSLGRLLQGRGNDADAITLFCRAGALKPDLAPVHVELAASLHRLGHWDDALLELDRALALDPAFSVAHDTRGLVLCDLGRFQEACQAHWAALRLAPPQALPERISTLLNLAKAAFGADEFRTAEEACHAVMDMDADHADAIDYLATILYRLRRDDEALGLLNRLARIQGLAKRACSAKPEATILVLGGVGAGHVPTRYLFDPALFATLTLPLVSPDQPDAPLGGVPYAALAEANLILNTLGEVEKDGGQVAAVKALAAGLGKPVLNSPEGIARTGRDRAFDLYGDIPGLQVPRVRWMMRDELENLPAGVTPFLIRPGGVHGGEGLARIGSSSELWAYLLKVPQERFLLTDFYDFRGQREAYRKYRFIFVDRQPFAYHLAIGESWLVHYWRARMGSAEWKKQEEAIFLNDWRQVFGSRAAAAVERVGQRMNLDYGGLDCSLLPNGDVLFLEANACMLVHLDDAMIDFAYKHTAVPRIRDAVTQMVRDRISRASHNCAPKSSRP